MPSALVLGEGLRTAVFVRVELNGRQGRRVKGVTTFALLSHCKHRSMYMYVTHTTIVACLADKLGSTTSDDGMDKISSSVLSSNKAHHCGVTTRTLPLQEDRSGLN